MRPSIRLALALAGAATCIVSGASERAWAEPVLALLEPAPAGPNADASPAALQPEPVIGRGEDVRELTIFIAGDLGLGGSDQPVHPLGAYRHGTLTRWAELTAGIAPLMTADLHFANLETVVTDRNDLRPAGKRFHFRSHPAGLRHLVRLGIGALSLANNHTIDYGPSGMEETLRHVDLMREHGLAGAAGLGRTRSEALTPADMRVAGFRVRMAAIGIGSSGLSPSNDPAAPRAGMLSYNSQTDLHETLDRLVEADGDIRILSVHYGAELQVRPSPNDQARLRDDAAGRAGIDLVIGHHAHVAAGVQEIGGKFVFYGLGNFLHPGMQDMGKFGPCRDFGLAAYVHFSADQDGRPRVAAVETVALTDMHARAREMAPQEAALRIAVFNHHANGLDDEAAGARGVRFTQMPNGRGLYCVEGAGQSKGRIGQLCKDWQPPATPPDVARRAAAACGSGPAPSLASRDRRDAIPPSPARRAVADTGRASADIDPTGRGTRSIID